MYAFAEHPKVIANHQVLRQNVKNDTPRGIFDDHIIRLNHELVPEQPRDAAQGQGDEELRVNADSSTLKRPADEIQ
jgi:hypothetical protein